METRRENRPVSLTVASGPLTPDMMLSVARSAKPCARDPPPPRPQATTLPAGPRAGGRATANPPGKTSRHPRPQNREGRCDNIAPPERRTSKASPRYS
jgi:hypothetical protein